MAKATVAQEGMIRGEIAAGKINIIIVA